MLFQTNTTMLVKGKLLDLSTPIVMGILNTTPDSFFDGGTRTTIADHVAHARNMHAQGASIIDLGGYSSRPGADEVSETEELHRTISVLKALLDANPDLCVSIDTWRANVAAQALQHGAAIVNDISGGTRETEIVHVAAQYKAPFVVMHSRGTPKTMMQYTQYNDLLSEMTDYFLERIETLTKAGIHDICIDPGFGFAKNVDQNYFILRNLAYFKSLNVPILVGLSRKSMIYKILGNTSQNSLNGSTVLHTLALTQGAQIIRVHDVKEAIECISLYKHYTSAHA